MLAHRLRYVFLDNGKHHRQYKTGSKNIWHVLKYTVCPTAIIRSTLHHVQRTYFVLNYEKNFLQQPTHNKIKSNKRKRKKTKPKKKQIPNDANMQIILVSTLSCFISIFFFVQSKLNRIESGTKSRKVFEKKLHVLFINRKYARRK